MKNIISKKENLKASLNHLFETLFKSGVIKYIMYPRIVEGKDMVFQCLTKSLQNYDDNGIFLPVMPLNSAKVISDFSFNNFNDKVGVVIRPCEAKAVIELIKLKQINREDIVIITFDCLGTADPVDFQKILNETGNISKLESNNTASYIKGKTAIEENIRKSCQACDIPVYSGDINLGIIGVDEGLSISMDDEIFEKIKDDFNKEPAEEEIGRRLELIEKIKKTKTAVRDKVIEEFRNKINKVDDMVNRFSACMRCYNCRVACPICYCRECIFDTKIFEHAPSTYKKWLDKKGSVKVPVDTLLFHLTRLNHMSFSCINCGYCSSACPNGLPVYELFLSIGSEVKKLFEYVPGINLEDAIPLTEFKENELEETEG